MVRRARDVDRTLVLATVFLLVWLALAPTATADGGPVPPGAPVALVARPGPNQSVILAWLPPADDGGAPVTEYRVYRALLPGAVAFVGASSATTFIDGTLAFPGSSASPQAGPLVIYQVTAKNTAGESVESAPALFTPGPSCIAIIPEWPFVSVDPSCIIRREGVLVH